MQMQHIYTLKTIDLNMTKRILVRLDEETHRRLSVIKAENRDKTINDAVIRLLDCVTNRSSGK